MQSVYIFLVFFNCVFVYHVGYCLATSQTAKDKGSSITTTGEFVACITPCIKNYDDQLRNIRQYWNFIFKNINFTPLQRIISNIYATKIKFLKECISPCNIGYRNHVEDFSNSLIEQLHSSSLHPILDKNDNYKEPTSNLCTAPCIKNCSDHRHDVCENFPYYSSIFFNRSDFIAPPPVITLCLSREDRMFQRCTSSCIKNCSNLSRKYSQNIPHNSKGPLSTHPTQPTIVHSCSVKLERAKAYDEEVMESNACYSSCLEKCNDDHPDSSRGISCLSECRKACDYDAAGNMKIFSEASTVGPRRPRRSAVANRGGAATNHGVYSKKHFKSRRPLSRQQRKHLKSKKSAPKYKEYFIYKNNPDWKIMKKIIQHKMKCIVHRQRRKKNSKRKDITKKIRPQKCSRRLY